jgi:hypothetical protein
MNCDEELRAAARRSLVRLAVTLAITVPAAMAAMPFAAPGYHASAIADCVVGIGDLPIIGPIGGTTGGSCA